MNENSLPDLRQRAREWIAGFHEATEQDRVNCVALLLDAAETAYQCAAEGHRSKREDYTALVEQAPRDRLPAEHGHEEGNRAMTMCGGHDGVDIEQSGYGAPRVIAAPPSAAFAKRLLADADPAVLRVEGDRITVCGQAVYEVVDPEHACGPAGEPTVLARLVEVCIR